MRPPIHHLPFACVLVLPLFAAAQTGAVNGYVYEQATADPSIFTPVSLVGTSFCAITDVQGYFCISKLPPGRYTLRIVYFGYDTLTKVVLVKVNQIETVKCYLKSMAHPPQYVEVVDSTPVRPIFAYRMTPKDLERVPPVGCVDDEVRSPTTRSLPRSNPSPGRPTIFFLLSMADCLDSACVSERARNIHYCFMGGGQEDGWNWLSCDYLRADSISDFERLVTLGFFGYPRSNYRDYIIATGDTAAADTLTAELLRLGFQAIRPHPDGQIYGCGAFPEVELQRLEHRHHSLDPRGKEDPPHPRAQTKEVAGRETWEAAARVMKEAGYDSFDIVPHLMWVFKVRVHTPR
jgi:hypothetical protein